MEITNDYPEFPDPSPSQLSFVNDMVRWIDLPGIKTPQVPEQAMEAILVKEGLHAMLLGLLSTTNVLPFPIHVSPLYCMLSRLEKTDPYRKQYMSSLSSITFLMEFKCYYEETEKANIIAKTPAGVEETETERVENLQEIYEANYKTLTSALYTKLDELFLYCLQKDSISEAFEPFYNIMRDYTFDFIHLLEYSVLQLADPEGLIPLECILTPKASISIPPTSGEEMCIHKFFKTKSFAMNEQLKMTGSGYMCHDWFPTISTLGKGEWINSQIVRDYFFFMDFEEQMTKFK